MNLEFYSYVFDFANKISYKGNLKYLMQAMKSSDFDRTNNYEPLETLGDSVIKFLTTLSLYTKYPYNSEKKLTENRSYIVSNKNLCELSKKFDFQLFIKTKALTVSAFRPAYYTKKASNIETINVFQLLTDNILADFYEAVVGCFFVGSGLLASAEFLMRFGLIDEDCSEKISTYLSNDKFELLSPFCRYFLLTKSYKIDELFTMPDNKTLTSNYFIKKLFDYSFANEELLFQAFTHNSISAKNYEILEFLGDSILDLIVLSNVYHFSEFSSNQLSHIKQLLVCNQNLSCICLNSGLSRFIKINKKYLSSKIFEVNVDKVDVICDNIFNLQLPKYLGDVVEALIGAVFLDTQSFVKTAGIVGK